MSLDLQDLADSTREHLGIAGAQVSVWHDGQALDVTSGVSSVTTGQPVTTDTLFSIGSTTKVHTAVLVLQLVEEGLLDLDDPVAKHLPGFRLADVDATDAVTPRMLMSMSSGIDNGPYSDHGRGDDALGRYVDALADLPMAHAPGEGFGYSNASTVVSGRLVQELRGQDWESVLHERLLDPAGLHDSAVHAEDVIWRRNALGHVLSPEGRPEPVPGWNVSRCLGPAGALLSTAADLVRLGRVFTGGGRGVLSAELVDQAHAAQVQVPPTLQADTWGLGPYGKTWDGRRVHGHSGTTPIGSSYLLWVPELDAVLATTVNTARQGYPFAQAVMAVVFPELFGIGLPPKPAPLEDVPADLQRFVGSFEMTDMHADVTADADGLLICMTLGPLLGDTTTVPSRLRPIGPSTFVATDPLIDGNRGWGLSFVGAADGPATHLVNGFWCLRRVA